MKPLTIALCLHGYFPEQFFGTAVYVKQLAQGLRHLGHRPVIIAPRINPSSSVATLDAAELLDGVSVHRVLRPVSRNVRDGYHDPRLVGALREALASIAPDVVHVAHFLGLTTAIFEAAHSLNLPTFATFTDFHGFCHRGTLLNARTNACVGPNRFRTNCVGCGLRDEADRRPESFALAYLASWFARPTSSVALPLLKPVLPKQAKLDIQAVVDRPEHLRRAMSCLRAAIAPTRVLYDAYRRNGFTIPIEISPFGIEADRRAKPSRPPGPLRVGFIGQIGRHKGCHILIEAARHLRPGSATIEIWGDMTRHPAYALGLRKTARGRDVTFSGSLHLKEMDATLRNLDVLVMPSIWAENAPLTLLQALACGTPCIVSDQPGMTEFVRHGINGHVVRPRSGRALAVAIQHMADDRDHLARLTAAAHYHHDGTAMAKDVVDMYERHGVGPMK